MKHNHYGFGILSLLIILFSLGSAIGIGVYTYTASHPSVVHTPVAKKPVVNPSPKPTGSSLTLTDDDKGKTVSITIGEEFSVSLGSTYWNFAPLTSQSVVAAVGSTVPYSDKKCVPGGGCGTQTQVYKAMSAGTVTISASRNSCGEALGCGVDAANYSVTIVVR